MPIDDMFGKTFQLVARNLDLRARNHTYIAGNVANAETPNYVSKSLSFENELKNAVKTGKSTGTSPTTNTAHIPLKGMAATLEEVHGVVEESASPTLGKDGNGVDLEREMGRLAENQILYNASVQVLSKQFELLKYAVKGGN
jgi:flagellar basal-body rod protein FlgB